MMDRFAARLVSAAQARPVSVVVLAILAAAVMAWWTAGHLGVNTDTIDMIDSKAEWRAKDRAHEEQFPQNEGLVVAVIDGATADLAEDAAATLAAALAERPDRRAVTARRSGRCLVFVIRSDGFHTHTVVTRKSSTAENGVCVPSAVHTSHRASVPTA
jgi:predicted RND superfamily exporter protein